MNKPARHIVRDDDRGPLDADGQQVLTTAEEAAIERMEADPRFRASIARAEADIAAGRIFTHEEVIAMNAERRRRWRSERGL